MLKNDQKTVERDAEQTSLVHLGLIPQYNRTAFYPAMAGVVEYDLYLIFVLHVFGPKRTPNTYFSRYPFTIIFSILKKYIFAKECSRPLLKHAGMTRSVLWFRTGLTSKSPDQLLCLDHSLGKRGVLVGLGME